MAEVTRQMRSLSQQAAAANEYKVAVANIKYIFSSTISSCLNT